MSGAPPATTGGQVEPARAGRPWLVNAIVAVVYIAGLVCVVGSLVVAADQPLPPAWGFLAALVVFTVAESLRLPVRFNGQEVTAAMGEAAFVVALAFLPLPWIVPVCTVAVLIAYAVNRTAPVKIFFNGGVGAIGLTLGCLAANAIGGVSSLPRSDGYLAAAAGALIYATWGSIPVTAVISAASGAPWRFLIRHEFEAHRVPTSIGYAAAGVSVLALAHWTPVTLLVLPPVLTGLFYANRANVKSVEQRNDWKQLNAAAKELADLHEEAIEPVVGRRAAQLFGADATLSLYPTTPDDLAAQDLATLAADRPPEPAVPLPRKACRPLLTRMREIAVPLVAGTLAIGELRLTFTHPRTWGDHEDQVLAAFANTLSSAIVRKRLFDQARRQAEDKAYEATHDALTGLGNRRLLGECAKQMLAAAEASRARVGLLLIDLDRFKDINDSLGHSAGDRVLRGIADRLQHSVRTGDVVTRLGGDEFAVLVSDIHHPAQAESVAADLAEVLARPIELDEFTLAVEGSVGVAVYPDDGANTEELLSRADVAMYQAKRAHPRWQRYRPDRDLSNVDRLSLLAELRPAIGGGDIVLYYQPQMALRGGRITGVEALVRWKHPVRGLLTPETFVPAVEQSGFVQEFTRAILRQALEACAGWRDDGYDVGISVNLSARNLLNTDLPGEVAQLLLSYQVPAPALTLEITETAMMADPETAESLLASLSEIGVRIAVDDFGTGYSSLTLLQRCVLHEVKVDRAFVQRLLLERSDAAIVAATIQLAHSLGLKVVAEGVESQALVEALAALHCDTGQGLHIGGAMPLPELTRWLADSNRTARLDIGPGARILPLHPRRPATG